MEIKEQILEWSVSQGKNLNQLNKKFQDTLMNYYLEDYIAPIFMEDFKMKVCKDIHSYLKQKVNKSSGLPKYMELLNTYIEQMKQYQRTRQYNRILCTIAQEETSASSPNFQTAMWKKCVSLLLLQHSLNPDFFSNFRDLWQCTFPGNPLNMKKLPKNNKSNLAYFKKRVIVLQKQQKRLDRIILQNNDLLIKMLQTKQNEEWENKIEKAEENQLESHTSLFPNQALDNQEIVTKFEYRLNYNDNDNQLLDEQQLSYFEDQFNSENDNYPTFQGTYNYFQSQENEQEINIYNFQNSFLNTKIQSFVPYQISESDFFFTNHSPYLSIDSCEPTPQEADIENK